MATTAPPDLATLPLFVGLPPADLARLAQLARPLRLPAGAQFITAGEPGEAAYVIVAGTVKVHLLQADGTDVLLTVRGPGEILGEMALLAEDTRSADVATLEPTRLLRLDRAALDEALATMPGLARNLLRILARRLRLASAQIRALQTQDVAGRLACQLLAYAEAYGVPAPDGRGVTIPVRLTQADLAALVGASRPQVNQALGHFKRRGYLATDRHFHTTIRDRASFGAYCA